MRLIGDPASRRAFDRLPERIQVQARQAYRRWLDNPSHPSLNFKRVNATRPIWSVPVTNDYRAVGLKLSNDLMLWLFIGTHAEYDALLKRF